MGPQGDVALIGNVVVVAVVPKRYARGRGVATIEGVGAVVDLFPVLAAVAVGIRFLRVRPRVAVVRSAVRLVCLKPIRQAVAVIVVAVQPVRLPGGLA